MNVKRSLILILAFLMIFGTLSFTVSANDPVTKMSDEEWAYLRLLNDERISKGLLPLSCFDALESACEVRAKELGKTFSHTRPNGSFWDSIFEEYGIKVNGTVETSIAGEKDYKKIFKSFCDNREQYNNLTRDFFRHSAQAFNQDADNSYKVTFNNILIGGCTIKRISLIGYDGNRMHMKVGHSLSDEEFILVCECEHGKSYMPVSSKALKMDSGKVGRQTATISYGDMTAPVNLYLDFADVDADAWYYAPVTKAYDNDLFSGTSSTEFSPNEVMTRAMFVTVLARVIDFDPSVCGSSGFSDVPDNAWYARAVAWASEEGIVSGTGANKFSPDAQITREQICLILTKFAEKLGVELPEINEEKIFNDEASISSWAAEAVNICQKAGIVSGDVLDNFNPAKGTKRCEAATMLVKFSDLVVKK